MKKNIEQFKGILKSYSSGKAISLAIIWATTLLTVYYSGYVELVADTPEQQNGVKAAIFALNAASTLFVRMIPRGVERIEIALHRFTELSIAGATFGAGAYWLISETSGSFLSTLVLLPFIAVILCVLWKSDGYIENK